MKNKVSAKRTRTAWIGLVLGLLLPVSAWADRAAIEEVKWKGEDRRLVVKGKGDADSVSGERVRIDVSNADSSEALFSEEVRRKEDGRWELEVKRRMSRSAVPCRIRLEAGNAADEAEVEKAPGDCVGGAGNLPPVANAGADQTVRLRDGQREAQVTLDGSASSDPDGAVDQYNWTGTPDPADQVAPGLSLTAGTYRFALQVTDDQGASSAIDTVTVAVLPPDATGGSVSINSTSQNAGQPGDPVAEPPGTQVPEQPLLNPGGHALLAANDLGMHCADLDYQVFSILPPFNVMHAQVVLKGGEPAILDHTDVEVVYSAAANPDDPALAQPAPGSVFKSNFWEDPDLDGQTLGFETYAPLFFGLLEPTDIEQPGTGLPVPDSVLLRNCLQTYLSGVDGPEVPRAECGLGQQVMPGQSDPYVANVPVPFDRFDHSVNFFNELLGGTGLGGIIEDANWFAADGVPITPVDDAGRSNAYPLMRVQARDKATGNVLASTDVVVPVASEADCQTCHARSLDCAAVDPTFNCREHALDRTPFTVMTLDGDEQGELPPGRTDLERLLNTAKINILRLHDAKHGTSLDDSRPVQCSTCHYSPALDLAQLGPMDAGGVSQTAHITMSRAMHGHHGELTDAAGNPLFPDMPGPVGRSPLAARDILEQTCYSCHPGKRTQCLRGAMAAGGVVCQDCHGEMRHVGNDFSEDLAQQSWPAGANLNKRVPWASEPGCQSCHTGDAVDNLADSLGLPAADDDGIRLLRAYTIRAGLDASGQPDGTELAEPIVAANMRFAENETLYRLSKGHGGVMCEGCHGSTHAIFPNPFNMANDNVAAKQLQGHAGTIVECSTCHTGDLGNTLQGPHGMHPVGDTRFARGGHEHMDTQTCKSCHGADGLGTVLSMTADDRRLECKDEKGSLCAREDQTITVARRTMIGCVQCHENYIDGEDDD